MMTKDSHHSSDPITVSCGILTVSDTRTTATDRSGQWAWERLTAAGYKVAQYEIVPDEPEDVANLVRKWSADAACQAIITIGGTGLSPRDTTVEAVSALLDKRIDGFGELFRALSYEQIGAAAMLSRAIAGSIATTAIFCLPGSSKAVELGIDKLIVPQLTHIVGLLDSKNS